MFGEELEERGKEEKLPSVRMVCRGGAEGRFELVGLTLEEIELMEGMLLGYNRVMVNKDGRLESVHSLKPVPEPYDDEDVMPYWSKLEAGQGVQMEMESFRFGSLEHHFPSIFIQRLCGYGFSPDSYRYNAELLERFGFVCLRSRRGPDGKFWELWFLPGVWAAKDELAEEMAKVGKKTEAEKTKIALDFLASRVAFGTLDVSVQRMAMSIE